MRLATLALTFLSACYTTALVPPAQLSQLQGNGHAVSAWNGQRVPIDGETSVKITALDPSDDNRLLTVSGHIRQLSSQNGVLHVDLSNGASFAAPLDSVIEVQATNFSPRKTLYASLAAVIPTAIVLAFVVPLIGLVTVSSNAR